MILARLAKTSTETLGILLLPGVALYTLEPPWRDNESNRSCIPVGNYRVEFMPRSASGKYRNCYHIQDVESRSGILIHNGNIHTHTLGCVLVGTRYGRLSGMPAVLNSKYALRQLYEIIGPNSFDLEIRNEFD